MAEEEPRALGNYPTLAQLQMMVTEMKIQHAVIDKQEGLKEQVSDFPPPEPPKNRTTKMQEILAAAGDGRTMKGREADQHSRKAQGQSGEVEGGYRKLSKAPVLSDTTEKSLRRHKIPEFNNNLQTGTADEWEEVEDTLTCKKRATSSSD